MRSVLPCLASLAVLVGAVPGVASPPDPASSDVPDCITITPDGSYTYTVVVRSVGGIPCAGSVVEILFDGNVYGMIAWCLPASPPLVFATTNAAGEASFVFRGGGCVLDPQYVVCGSPWAAQVSADGVILEQLKCINSPDVVNSVGSTPFCPPPTSVCIGGVTTVGLSDAVYHSGPIGGGYPDRCSDFTPPYGDNVGLGDAVFVTPYIKSGVTCPC